MFHIQYCIVIILNGEIALSKGKEKRYAFTIFKNRLLKQTVDFQVQFRIVLTRNRRWSARLSIRSATAARFWTCCPIRSGWLCSSRRCGRCRWTSVASRSFERGCSIRPWKKQKHWANSVLCHKVLFIQQLCFTNKPFKLLRFSGLHNFFVRF